MCMYKATKTNSINTFDIMSAGGVNEQQHKSSDKPRRVSWNESMRVVGYDSRSSFDQDEIKSMWYEPCELQAFNQQARILARQHLGQAPPAVIVDDNCECTDCLRGLELRVSRERQERKSMTIKFILRAQHKLGNSQLAGLAGKCNEWPARAAVAQAQRDRLEAAECVVAQLPALPPLDNFPLPIKMKRCSASAEQSPVEQQRRVRQRTCC